VSLQVADNLELRLQKNAVTAVLPKGTLKAI
jgi:preprotein translocase subunit YajC